MLHQSTSIQRSSNFVRNRDFKLCFGLAFRTLAVGLDIARPIQPHCVTTFAAVPFFPNFYLLWLLCPAVWLTNQHLSVSLSTCLSARLSVCLSRDWCCDMRVLCAFWRRRKLNTPFRHVHARQRYIGCYNAALHAICRWSIGILKKQLHSIAVLLHSLCLCWPFCKQLLHASRKI